MNHHQAGTVDIIGDAAGLEIYGRGQGHAGSASPSELAAMRASMNRAQQQVLQGQAGYPNMPGGFNPYQTQPPVAFGPNSHAVERQPSHRIRKQIAPFPPAAAILAGVGFTFAIQPQRGFRPDTLILSDNFGASTLSTVTDIQIAQKSQFIAAGVVPFQAFGAQAYNATFRFETAAPGIFITIGVFNGNATAATVYGVFFGESVDV